MSGAGEVAKAVAGSALAIAVAVGIAVLSGYLRNGWPS